MFPKVEFGDGDELALLALVSFDFALGVHPRNADAGNLIRIVAGHVTVGCPHMRPQLT